MKSKKGYEKFLDALITLACNYATVDGLLVIYKYSERELYGGIALVICIFYISTLYED